MRHLDVLTHGARASPKPFLSSGRARTPPHSWKIPPRRFSRVMLLHLLTKLCSLTCCLPFLSLPSSPPFLLPNDHPQQGDLPVEGRGSHVLVKFSFWDLAPWAFPPSHQTKSKWFLPVVLLTCLWPIANRLDGRREAIWGWLLGRLGGRRGVIWGRYVKFHPIPSSEIVSTWMCGRLPGLAHGLVEVDIPLYLSIYKSLRKVSLCVVKKV